jgi:hypothetical protein
MSAISQGCERETGIGLGTLGRILDEPHDRRCHRKKHDCVVADRSGHTTLGEEENAERTERGGYRQERRAEHRCARHSVCLASSIFAA